MLIPTMSSNYRYYNNASRGEPLHDNTISLGKLLGTGWDGKVYEDKRHSAFVIKVCAETPNIRTELEAEVELFNRYYGENSAALINDTTIRMKKISGIPLDEVEGKIFNERSIERFNEMICNLGDKKIMLKDFHPNNILYDSENNIFNPIDFSNKYDLFFSERTNSLCFTDTADKKSAFNKIDENNYNDVISFIAKHML